MLHHFFSQIEALIQSLQFLYALLSCLYPLLTAFMKKLLEKHDLQVVELATIMYVEVSTVQRWKAGKRMPRKDQYKLLIALGQCDEIEMSIVRKDYSLVPHNQRPRRRRRH